MSTPNTHYGRALKDMLASVDAIYFLGIGGISMSSLAMLTARRGIRVGGYDRTRSEVTGKLEAAGIPVYDTPDAAHLEGFGAVVYTVAIAEDHPEYAEAQRRGLPLISRADYLGYLMLDYHNRIGFAGSHGKSTATCMCAQIFMSADTDPTVMSGAPMRSMGGAFRLGGENGMVFEACEYKDSFLDFNPNVAVLLNCELDHVDYFKDMDQIRSSFAAFADRAGKDGCVIYNADDAETCRALESVTPRRVTFGVKDPAADYRATAITLTRGYAAFDLWHKKRPLGRVSLRVPGEHNVYNALAAAAAAHECGLCSRDIIRGLEDFEGAVRRMEYKGKMNGADVFDDYGHHPTEVKATLRESRLLGQGRLICAFQPHTYSRTATLFDDYVDALMEADEVVVAPIYAAREVDDCGVSATKLAEAINARAGREVARGCEDMALVAGALCELACPGDTVIVMGAGNIDSVYVGLPLEK
jgi:UDP-N-acetylmuramate--alanine ligase